MFTENLTIRNFLRTASQIFGAGLLSSFCAANASINSKKNNKGTSKKKPNIVFFLFDDMGNGDVSCLNPQGKITAPHIDSLTKQGMIFTDVHSTSSVCSPTRYSFCSS